MKFGTAAALILAYCGNTSAFSATTPINGGRSIALNMGATATETYTFTKSEEIFAEAKTVSNVLSIIHTNVDELICKWYHMQKKN